MKTNLIIIFFRHALDEYTIVANSFRYQQMFTNQLFFALVDFDEAQDVFQQVSYYFQNLIICLTNQI